MTDQPRWGVVATIKATDEEILNFAAHHLELGAHRLFVFLDEDRIAARKALSAHPKCRVTLTDALYWKRRRHKGRPETHQHRQSVNATHAYHRAKDLDWLLHIDVDEFLWPATPIQQMLAELPPETISARVLPIEAMASDPSDPPPDGQIWCKGFVKNSRARREQTNRIYPGYGDFLNGGMLSHVEGKVFVRTGRDNVRLRIHNALIDGAHDPASIELAGSKLVHLHGDDWDTWRDRLGYRLRKGAYRASLKSAPRSIGTSKTKHELFNELIESGGEPALLGFFNAVCLATPDLRARLDREGHLHAVTLDLARKRHAHFDALL